MNEFKDLLKESYNELEDIQTYIDDFIFDSLDEDDLDFLQEEYGYTLEEAKEAIEENRVKSIDSRGNVSRKKSRKKRKKQATKTTGMSRSQLKRRAKKSAKTRKRNPGKLRKSVRKRNKAMKKRKQRGIR